MITRNVFYSVVFYVLIFSCVASGRAIADDSLIPFSLENSAVNKALIVLYEDKPEIWKEEQLYLIGLCYVSEKRLVKAEKLFEELNKNDPSNTRIMRALGNVYHMKGSLQKAEFVYKNAWENGNDVTSLKQLSVLRLQKKNLKGIADILEPLMIHQKENLEIQKVLLSYSIMVEDDEKGGPVYGSVVRSLGENLVEKHEDLRELLLMATARYKDAAKRKDSGTIGATSENKK